MSLTIFIISSYTIFVLIVIIHPLIIPWSLLSNISSMEVLYLTWASKKVDVQLYSVSHAASINLCNNFFARNLRFFRNVETLKVEGEQGEYCHKQAYNSQCLEQRLQNLSGFLFSHASFYIPSFFFDFGNFFSLLQVPKPIVSCIDSIFPVIMIFFIDEQVISEVYKTSEEYLNS